MLCYRGVQYAPYAHLYQTIPGDVIGKYRGIEVRSRRLTTTVPQPHHALVYRGIAYATGHVEAVYLMQY